MKYSHGILSPSIIRLFRLLIILIAAASTTVVAEGSLPDNILNNLRLTHINDVVETANCPAYHWIIGLRLRVAQPRKSPEEESVPKAGAKTKSNTIPVDESMSTKPYINGIEITCSNGYHAKTIKRKFTFGVDGKWENQYELCKKGFAVGIPYEMTDTSNPAMTNINNMGIYCSGESLKSETVIIDDNSVNTAKEDAVPRAKIVDKDEKKICGSGEAVDSISIKADSIITIQKGDLFSITELRVRCSTVINPAHRCNLSFRWDRRRGVKCNNLSYVEEVASTIGKAVEDIKRNVTCSVDAWTGVDFDRSYNNAEKIFSRFETVGTGNDREYVAKALAEFLKKDDIQLWFDVHLPRKSSHVIDYISNPKWKTNGTFTEIVEVSPELFMDPIDIATRAGEKLLYSPFMYQLVAFCDIYKIAFSAFTAGIDVYYNTKINKRKTRISFLAFNADS